MNEQEKNWREEYSDLVDRCVIQKSSADVFAGFLTAKRQDAERIAELESENRKINGLLILSEPNSDALHRAVKRISELEAVLEAVSKERDELAALVEVMRDALQAHGTCTHEDDFFHYECTVCVSCSVTPSDALREVKAMVAADCIHEVEMLRVAHDPRLSVPGDQYYAKALTKLYTVAAAIRKGT